MKTLNILLMTAAIAVAKPAKVADSFQSGVGKIREGYLNIQLALANDDFQKSRTAAESLTVVIKKIHAGDLKAETKSRWDSSSAGLLKALNPMASAKDIEALRSNFKALTPCVVGAIEKFGAKPAASAYLFDFIC